MYRSGKDPGRAQESIFLCESEILIHDNTTGTIAMIIFQDRHDQLLVTRNEPSPVPTNGRFPGLLLFTYKTAFPVSQWRIFIISIHVLYEQVWKNTFPVPFTAYSDEIAQALPLLPFYPFINGQKPYDCPKQTAPFALNSI